MELFLEETLHANKLSKAMSITSNMCDMLKLDDATGRATSESTST